MTKFAVRWAAAQWHQLSRRPERNRQRYYAGATGLRMLTFHALPKAAFPRFQGLVEWCLQEYAVTAPDLVDTLPEGRWRHSPCDQILLTFDDGYDNHYAAARWLADLKVQAIFFVVPSFLGRTLAEYMRFHADQGIQAFDFTSSRGPCRGLSLSQVQEMMAMGHRIAAHNYAHRDLGKLRREPDIQYEVQRSLQAIAELTDTPCEDFAFAFGHTRCISDAAVAYLHTHCQRVYTAVRGLNVPGVTSAFFLRDTMFLNYPTSLSKLCIKGGADDRYAAYRAELLQRTGQLPLHCTHSTI